MNKNSLNTLIIGGGGGGGADSDLIKCFCLQLSNINIRYKKGQNIL